MGWCRSIDKQTNNSFRMEFIDWCYAVTELLVVKACTANRMKHPCYMLKTATSLTIFLGSDKNSRLLTITSYVQWMK